MGWFAWFSQDSPRVVSGFISELWIADVVCVQNIGGELSQGLSVPFNFENNVLGMDLQIDIPHRYPSVGP
jgi:hypothetical protein